MWLLLVAAFGLTVPNGLFVYWLFTDFRGFGPVLQDRLAMAFMLDALLATAILTGYVARHPLARVRWHGFLALSLIGGIGFSLPFCWWLSRRTPGFAP